MKYIHKVNTDLGRTKYCSIINNIKYYTGISLTPEIYLDIVKYCNINYK